MDIETTIINNIEYIIYKEIPGYVYLVNSNDGTDFLLKRVVIRNNEEYFENLESKEEFDDVLKRFLSLIQKDANN